MGIDQSYTSSGVVVLDGDFLLHREQIKTSKDEDIFKRSWDIACQIKKIADFYKPGKIRIEGLAFGIRGSATRDLGGLQFMIVNLLRHSNGTKYEVEIIPPLSLKKFATGDGRAKKNLVIESLPQDVHENFLEMGVKKTTGLADMADAYFLAKYKEV